MFNIYTAQSWLAPHPRTTETPVRVTGGNDWKGVIVEITVPEVDPECRPYYGCYIRCKGSDILRPAGDFDAVGFSFTPEGAQEKAVDRLQRYHGRGFPQPAQFTGNTPRGCGVGSKEPATST